MTKFIIIKTWALKEKSFSTKEHKDIKLMNQKKSLLITNESPSMALTQYSYCLIFLLFTLLLVESPSSATAWGTPCNPSSGVPLSCRICKHTAGLAPSQEPYQSTSRKSLTVHMHTFIITKISTCKYT
jgi:hypothetical protein